MVSSFGFGPRQKQLLFEWATSLILLANIIKALNPTTFWPLERCIERIPQIPFYKVSDRRSALSCLHIHVQNCWICISIAKPLFKYVSTQHGRFPPDCASSLWQKAYLLILANIYVKADECWESEKTLDAIILIQRSFFSHLDLEFFPLSISQIS